MLPLLGKVHMSQKKICAEIRQSHHGWSFEILENPELDSKTAITELSGSLMVNGHSKSRSLSVPVKHREHVEDFTLMPLSC
jgi:hypothetical protein